MVDVPIPNRGHVEAVDVTQGGQTVTEDALGIDFTSQLPATDNGDGTATVDNGANTLSLYSIGLAHRVMGGYYGDVYPASLVKGDNIIGSATSGELLGTVPTGDNTSIAIDPFDGSLWTTDAVNDKILHRKRSDGSLISSFAAGYPRGIDIDPADGTIFLCRGSSAIEQRTRDGTKIQNVTSPGSDPDGIAVDPADGTLWHIDQGNDVIYNLDRAGNILSSFSVSELYPYDLSVDPADGTLWYVDNDTTKNFHVERDGTAIENMAAYDTGPRGIAIDPADGSIWNHCDAQNAAGHINRFNNANVVEVGDRNYVTTRRRGSPTPTFNDLEAGALQATDLTATNLHATDHILGGASGSVANSELAASEVTFEIDETNSNLVVKAKFSDGLVYTGTVSLA